MVRAFRDNFHSRHSSRVDAEERFLASSPAWTTPRQSAKSSAPSSSASSRRRRRKLGDPKVPGAGHPLLGRDRVGRRHGAATIKSHHNVGGLPGGPRVRAGGAAAGCCSRTRCGRSGRSSVCPSEMVWRQPFPGPGLGDPDRWWGGQQERLDDPSRCRRDASGRDPRGRALPRALAVFCVLPAARWVGVQGDGRTYGYPIVIRAVTSRRRHDRRLGTDSHTTSSNASPRRMINENPAE